MSVNELVSSAKHGPAVAISILLSSSIAGVLNIVGWLSSAAAVLLAPLFFVLVLATYQYTLKEAKWLNRKWLALINDIHPKIEWEPRNLQTDSENQTFEFWMRIVNAGFKPIHSYRVLLFVPMQILPPGTNFGAHDKSRSTGSHMCLRLPTPNEKTPAPLTDNEPRAMSLGLAVRKNSITAETLGLSFKYSLEVEGLLVESYSINLGSMFSIEHSNQLTIKAVKKGNS